MVSGVGDNNMSIKLRRYIGKASAMHREDIGDVLPMSSRCIGSASRVHRECIADVSGTTALGCKYAVQVTRHNVCQSLRCNGR